MDTTEKKNIKLTEDQINDMIILIDTIRIGFGEKDVESHKKKLEMCKDLLEQFPEVREKMRKNAEDNLVKYLKNRNLS